MLSFSKIITFAAVAFGTLCQAVPLSPRDDSTGPPAPVQLKGLLTQLKTQLVVAVEPINCLTHDNATASAVLPILEGMNVILDDAVKRLGDLVVEPVDELLKDVNDVLLTVDEVFDLVRDVLTVVFEALKVVYEQVAYVSISDLFAILSILCNTITALLKCITDLTAAVFGNMLVLKLQVFVAGSLVVGVSASLQLPSIFL